MLPTLHCLIACLIALCVVCGTSLIPAAYGMEPATPLAGEAFQTEVFGEPMTVHTRDRKSVTSANFGVQYLQDGPSFYQILPFGALYVWHNSDDEKQRFRGIFSGA